MMVLREWVRLKPTCAVQLSPEIVGMRSIQLLLQGMLCRDLHDARWFVIGQSEQAHRGWLGCAHNVDGPRVSEVVQHCAGLSGCAA